MSTTREKPSLDSLTARPPEAVAERLRALARESGISLNHYLVAILTDAADRGVIVEQEIKNVIHYPPAGKKPRATSRVAETR